MKKRTFSIRSKLFLTLAITVAIIILLLILLNTFVLEAYYIYSKQQVLKSVYKSIDNYYNNINLDRDIKLELEKTAIDNNFDIIIKTEDNMNLYTTNKDFSLNISKINEKEPLAIFYRESILYSSDNIVIRRVIDRSTSSYYILLSGKLDNGYILYIRAALTPMRESVKISNSFLTLIGGFAIIIAGIAVLFISRKYTNPILELNEIAKKMANLDFSKKYKISNTNDEINELGRSMNIVSEKLEKTINQLKDTNIELEKDIEEKSQIDIMRKQFISDVSHELKTPIALIQGYAEGLIENVNTDEESRKYYVEVIQDEANKMDKLVKQLLELMKLEYGKREFNNTKFDITELITEVIRKSMVMIDEKDVKVKFKKTEPIYVFADDFYIEQVVTNYLTNAIKNVEEINNKKEVTIKISSKQEKVRITVYNTGKQIAEENLNKIWNRFYKEDSSRNRENGGSGIGLSFVKAIMTNYNKEYGVINKKDGVEFYFELEKAE